jgi:predicted phosphodiesterase
MIKYLRIASDLHLDGFLGQTSETLRAGFLPSDPRDAESILILAGDISSNGEQLVGFLAACAAVFPKVIYVPGNHEWYKHDYTSYEPELSQAILSLPHDNIEFSLHGVGYEEMDDLKVRFIFGTLWGDGGPTLGDQGAVGFYLNDFRLISNGRTPKSTAQMRFTVQDMIAVYRDHKAKIAEQLAIPYDGKTVVITHHLPSRRLVSARFWPTDGSDGANGGFVGNCDDLLAADNAPDLWVHGHTHDRISTTLWKTRIECNPAGYKGEWMTKFNTFMRPNKNGSREVVPLFVRLSDLEVDPSSMETL